MRPLLIVFVEEEKFTEYKVKCRYNILYKISILINNFILFREYNYVHKKKIKAIKIQYKKI